MQTKLSKLKDKVAAGDWNGAILIAAKFQELGEERDAILSAREAILRPAFQRMIKKDPAALIEAGKQALVRRYSL